MTIRNLKRAVAALAAVGLFVGGSSVARNWDHENYVFYYADEDHTVEVGGEYHPCSGPWQVWGEITRYAEYVEGPACPT